jgi:hypothetical protein
MGSMAVRQRAPSISPPMVRAMFGDSKLLDLNLRAVTFFFFFFHTGASPLVNVICPLSLAY